MSVNTWTCDANDKFDMKFCLKGVRFVKAYTYTLHVIEIDTSPYILREGRQLPKSMLYLLGRARFMMENFDFQCCGFSPNASQALYQRHG